MNNIILIGMPGSGKTTLGRLTGERLGRTFYDCDEMLAESLGMPVSAFCAARGEDTFRAREALMLSKLCSYSNAVISTGGGCVVRASNERVLRQSGIVLWLRRELALLERTGRLPVFSRNMGELFAAREPLYRKFSDAAIDNNSGIEDALTHILNMVQNMGG